MVNGGYSSSSSGENLIKTDLATFSGKTPAEEETTIPWRGVPSVGPGWFFYFFYVYFVETKTATRKWGEKTKWEKKLMLMSKRVSLVHLIPSNAAMAWRPRRVCDTPLCLCDHHHHNWFVKKNLFPPSL